MEIVFTLNMSNFSFSLRAVSFFTSFLYTSFSFFLSRSPFTHHYECLSSRKLLCNWYDAVVLRQLLVVVNGGRVPDEMHKT